MSRRQYRVQSSEGTEGSEYEFVIVKKECTTISKQNSILKLNVALQRIGEDWTVHLDQLVQLKKLAKDRAFQDEIIKVKQGNKRNLAQLLQQEYHIPINPASIFDIQVGYFN